MGGGLTVRPSERHWEGVWALRLARGSTRGLSGIGALSQPPGIARTDPECRALSTHCKFVLKKSL